MKTPILILTAFSLATAATAQGGMQTPTPPATPDAAMPAPAVSPDPATAAPTMAAPPAAAPMPDATAPAAAPSAMMATPAPNAMPAATATTDSASYPTCSRTVKDKCVNRGVRRAANSDGGERRRERGAVDRRPPACHRVTR